jgi:hypothetical protein
MVIGGYVNSSEVTERSYEMGAVEEGAILEIHTPSGDLYQVVTFFFPKRILPNPDSWVGKTVLVDGDEDSKCGRWIKGVRKQTLRPPSDSKYRGPAGSI